MFKYIDCIDSGTDFCPCSLAERGECIICSQLKDKVFCDCLNWRGTCIYQEYIWNNCKSKKSRQYKIYNIISKEYIDDDLLIMKIKVNRYLAAELNNIGAFVFLKCFSEVEAYSTPISILDSDIVKNIITVAIKVNGIKTKGIAECESKIMLKGPYWNGIQGQDFLNNLKGSRCLIIGGGVAMAPAVMAAKKMSKRDNEVIVLLGTGKAGISFSKKYFEEYGCIVYERDYYDICKYLSSEGEVIVKDMLNKYKIDVVLSAGNDGFHERVLNYMYSIDKDIKFATVNNSTICCGEGICGSCQLENKNGDRIKSCKQQYNPAEIFIKEMNIE